MCDKLWLLRDKLWFLQVINSVAFSKCFSAFIITIVGFKLKILKKNHLNFPKKLLSNKNVFSSNYGKYVLLRFGVFFRVKMYFLQHPAKDHWRINQWQKFSWQHFKKLIQTEKIFVTKFPFSTDLPNPPPPPTPLMAKISWVSRIFFIDVPLSFLSIVHKGVIVPPFQDTHPLTQLALFKIFVSLPLFSILSLLRHFRQLPPPSCRTTSSYPNPPRAPPPPHTHTHIPYTHIDI